MSGALSLARFKTLNAGSDLTDAQIRFGLSVAQAVAESLSGLVFGSEVVTASITASGTTYTIPFYGGTYEVGQLVRLVGGGVAATLFEVTDAGVNANGSLFIRVVSAVAIAPTKILPAFDYIGTASSNELNVDKRPLFSVVSVKTKASADVLWSDNQVKTIESTNYEVYSSRGINRGVRIKQSAIPLRAEGGPYLVKRMVRQAVDGIKVSYVAGFYSQVPADIEGAIVQLVPAIVGASKTGGVFASESHDYYSYSLLSYDQLAMLPFAAVGVLRSYARR